MPTSDVKIKVSMPVTLGGYTGQRDAWEENDSDFQVTKTSEGRVKLKQGGPIQRSITFDLETLQAALRALETSGKPQIQAPIYRNGAPTTGAEALH